MDEITGAAAPANSPESVVRRYWKLWAAHDRLAALTLVADDVVFAMYIPEDVLPFGGETKGKAAASDRLISILEQFDPVRYEGEVVRVSGDTVHGQVNYLYRHRLTREAIEGSMRVVVTVRNGLIVRWDEYQDLARIRAFMRLVSYVAHSES